MNPEAITAAKRTLELEEKVTPGPWNVTKDDGVWVSYESGRFDITGNSVAESDAAFIAHTRNTAADIARELLETVEAEVSPKHINAETDYYLTYGGQRVELKGSVLCKAWQQFNEQAETIKRLEWQVTLLKTSLALSDRTPELDVVLRDRDELTRRLHEENAKANRADLANIELTRRLAVARGCLAWIRDPLVQSTRGEVCGRINTALAAIDAPI